MTEPAIGSGFRNSLRLHLIGWLTVPLAAVALFMAWLTHANASLTAGLVTDRLLLASAQTIAGEINVQDGVISALIPPSALGIFNSGAGDRVIYKVLDPSGDLIAGLPDVPLPSQKVAALASIGFDAIFRGQPYRFAAVAQPLAGVPKTSGDYGGDALIVVGSTTRERDALAASLWLQGVQPMAVMLVLVAALGWLGLVRGLKPLDQLRRAVADRSGDHLSPLPLEGMPTEVRPLVLALNDALARLDRYIDAQRRFIANAAHQMRTPLTVLKMQTHYGLTGEGDGTRAEALTALDRGIDALMRLVGQLLILARAEPRTPTKPDVKPADMGALVGEALVSLGPLALDRDIDLSFDNALEDAEPPARVKASPTLLREMVVNLVDNALRYTPKGGTVAVSLDRSSDSVRLRVQDSGPGIPAEERTRVFERFYRVLGSGTEGNGLGLAIVHEIVTGAGGNVMLMDGSGGSGLTVEVILPTVELVIP
jgi:two-component system, OmpR family, sensor histidine kinase TctE